MTLGRTCIKVGTKIFSWNLAKKVINKIVIRVCILRKFVMVIFNNTFQIKNFLETTHTQLTKEDGQIAKYCQKRHLYRLGKMHFCFLIAVVLEKVSIFTLKNYMFDQRATIQINRMYNCPALSYNSGNIITVANILYCFDI